MIFIEGNSKVTHQQTHGCRHRATLAASMPFYPRTTSCLHDGTWFDINLWSGLRGNSIFFLLSQHSWDGWPLPLYLHSENSGIMSPCSASVSQNCNYPPLASSALLLLQNEMLIIGFCIKPAGLESDLETSRRPELNKHEKFKSFIYFQPLARCCEVHQSSEAPSCYTVQKCMWSLKGHFLVLLHPACCK